MFPSWALDPTMPTFGGLGRIRMKAFAMELDGVPSGWVAGKVRLSAPMADGAVDGSGTRSMLDENRL